LITWSGSAWVITLARSRGSRGSILPGAGAMYSISRCCICRISSCPTALSAPTIKSFTLPYPAMVCVLYVAYGCRVGLSGSERDVVIDVAKARRGWRCSRRCLARAIALGLRGLPGALLATVVLLIAIALLVVIGEAA